MGARAQFQNRCVLVAAAGAASLGSCLLLQSLVGMGCVRKGGGMYCRESVQCVPQRVI